MKFVFPDFLIALFALVIPIIIHLFSFRRFKKVYFSNVRFLQQVKDETQSQSKLKHILVLISRLLALSFLIFAFAQPYLPLQNKKIILGSNVVSIYVDNSFSMGAINKNGSMLDEAKKRAAEIVNAYQYSDRFQLLTNDFESNHQRLVNKEEFAEQLAEVKISPSVKTINEILTRQLDLLKASDSKSKVAYLISDFQKSTSSFSNIQNDSSVNVMVFPLSAQQKNNVYIDSCWFLSPVQQLNQVQKLSVKIKNKSEVNIENNPIKLYINGVQKAIASYSITDGGDAIVEIPFNIKETGIQHGKIEIKDYPITFDDAFFFNYYVISQISILTINSSEKLGNNNNENVFLNSLFGKDSTFIFKNVSESQLDYASFSSYQLIIVNELPAISTGLSQELKRFVSNGGSLLVLPTKEKMNFNSYKDFLTSLKCNYYESIDTINTKVDKINYEQELFEDVFDKKKNKRVAAFENIDLPMVQNHYLFSKATRNKEEYLLKCLNGSVFFNKSNYLKGKIYLSSVPLSIDFSNFPKHALFVPIIYKIAIYSQAQQKLFYTIGKDEPLEVIANTGALGENVFHIKGITNNFDIIPEHKEVDSKINIYVHNQLSEAGSYLLTEDNKTIGGLAYNYNRMESDLSCNTPEELNKQIETKALTSFKVLGTESKNLIQTLVELNQGKKLWKLCIILVLLFLGAEVLLIRFWKG